MVRIKVSNIDPELNGKVLGVKYIDESGDAYLSDADSERYGTRWILKQYFDVINEDEEQQFTVTLKIKDLLELHDLLQTLPRSLVESATLTTN